MIGTSIINLALSPDRPLDPEDEHTSIWRLFSPGTQQRITRAICDENPFRAEVQGGADANRIVDRISRLTGMAVGQEAIHMSGAVVTFLKAAVKLLMGKLVGRLSFGGGAVAAAGAGSGDGTPGGGAPDTEGDLVPRIEAMLASTDGADPSGVVMPDDALVGSDAAVPLH